MFDSTRRRLAIWYTTITAVVLLFFSTVVYCYVYQTLVDRIDDTLKHIIEVVEHSLVIDPIEPKQGIFQVNVEATFRRNSNQVEDDHIDLEWFNAKGVLLWSTFGESLHIPLDPNKYGKTVYLTNDHLLRQVTKRVEFDHYILGYLRVSHPWFEVTKPTRQLMIDLIFGVSFMLICVAGIGWFLSGIAIKPVIESYQSLKQFTADASHELRNPIAMIQTNISMALNYTDQESNLSQKQLQVIERLTKRLGNLVNDLLFLARSDSGMLKNDFEIVPLDALLIEVIEEQKILALQKEINLTLNLIEDDQDNLEEIFNLKGDWNQLARLFTNLISNSLNHSDQNDQVLIELKPIKKGNKNHSNRDKNKFLQVIIKDTGSGIPEASLPYIFDRFYRLDPARSNSQKQTNSTGLGLAIAKAIVENHQGNITVESELNQGTIFTVILPV